MKIVQFLLDYIDPSPAKKRDEQAKQYIIGINSLKKKSLHKRLYLHANNRKKGLFSRKIEFNSQPDGLRLGEVADFEAQTSIYY
jgi:hypothetical protein